MIFDPSRLLWFRPLRRAGDDVVIVGSSSQRVRVFMILRRRGLLPRVRRVMWRIPRNVTRWLTRGRVHDVVIPSLRLRVLVPKRPGWTFVRRLAREPIEIKRLMSAFSRPRQRRGSIPRCLAGDGVDKKRAPFVRRIVRRRLLPCPLFGRIPNGLFRLRIDPEGSVLRRVVMAYFGRRVVSTLPRHGVVPETVFSLLPRQHDRLVPRRRSRHGVPEVMAIRVVFARYLLPRVRLGFFPRRGVGVSSYGRSISIISHALSLTTTVINTKYAKINQHVRQPYM